MFFLKINKFEKRLHKMSTRLYLSSIGLLTECSSQKKARISIYARHLIQWPYDCRVIPTNFLSNKNSFPRDERIQFFEEAHEYYIDGKLCPISVTGLIHAPFPPFDLENKIKNMNINTRLTKYTDMSDLDIALLWRHKGIVSSSLGTTMHAAVEVFMNTKYVSQDVRIISEMEMMKNFYKNEIVDKGITPYRTEPTLFTDPNIPEFVSGSVDFVGIDKNGNIIIMDWKRIPEIKKTVNGAFGFGKENTMFGNLENVKYIHYSLQLHVYSYMFEKYYGKKSSELYIVTFHPQNKSYEKILAYDLSQHAQNLFDNFTFYYKEYEKHKKLKFRNEAWILAMIKNLNFDCCKGLENKQLKNKLLEISNNYDLYCSLKNKK